VRKFRNIEKVARILRSKYGVPTLGNKANPFDELLYIVLSSKTPPEKYRQAFLRLRQRYRRFDALATASVRTIARTVRFAGLERKKARQIRTIAQRLREKFGRVTLAPLRKMTNESAEALLCSLPGIGLKSARCVLMYSLGRKVFPVDNHCYRIASRLGWIRGSPWTRGVANGLQEGIPPALRKAVHVGMVLLGREYCVPKNPHCGSCPLLRHCPTGRERVARQTGKWLSASRSPSSSDALALGRS
jgi:endonuclease III